mgnify:CR=1 FL=1
MVHREQSDMFPVEPHVEAMHDIGMSTHWIRLQPSDSGWPAHGKRTFADATLDIPNKDCLARISCQLPCSHGTLHNKKEEDKEKVATAVLSITAKQKKKDFEKKKDAKDAKEEKMEVDEKKDEKKEKEKEEKKDEPNFEILQNPCRVVRPQLNLINLEEPTKHKPVKDLSIGGIIMMKRTDGSEENEAIVEPVTIAKAVVDSEDEPEPPEPFEYTD